MKEETLFITNDGVNIFQGNIYYIVDSELWFVSERIADKLSGQWVNEYTFSTKKIADEWCLMNAQKLSINDICDYFSTLAYPPREDVRKYIIEHFKHKIETND